MSTATVPPAPPPPPSSRALDWTTLTAMALLTWTGVHALRTFWSMLVWNVAEDRSPPEIALIALVFWAIGLAGWLAARWVGGPQPAVRFGLWFSLIYIANQVLARPLITPVLGLAAAILWLWLFSAVVTALSSRGETGILMPGMLLGLAAQVGLQAALHGLDLPVLHGVMPGLIALFLGASLFLVLRAALAGGSVASSTETPPGWGLAVLGPYLILQLTLLTNLGRVSFLTGWGMVASAAVILVGLAAAGASLTVPLQSWGRAAAGIACVLLLIVPSLQPARGGWVVAVIQVPLILAVAVALTPRPQVRPARVHAGLAAGWMLFFILMFLFYRRYGWPGLWPAMAAVAVFPAIATRWHVGPIVAGRAVAAVLLVGLVSVGVNVVGGRGGSSLSAPAPADLKVLNYNIHEAFNVWSIPDPLAIAAVITRADADVVALQEVGRGWNINGGPDLVAWLQWRFSQYHVVFAPLLGDLVGLTVMSRHPFMQSGRVLYPRRASRLPYGLVWVVIPTAAGDLLVINTHFSPYARFGADRAAQAQDLLAFWKGRGRSIVVGDFNAGPEEEAIKRLLAAGLQDVSAPHGLAAAFTYSSAHPTERRDYILSTPEIESLAAAIIPTTASDHLPVEARLRLR